ncbi:MAG: recombination protein RecR, partial [Acidimicrobiia bacterium]|nr:recombination protein RecR [Acidimicrobiia bacterium]
MFEGPVQRLVDELGRLPGIGQKTAQRLAFHLVTVDEADARRLGQAVLDMRDQIGFCSLCFNIAAADECAICRDTRRDTSVVCVVERPQDIVVVERTQEFRGRYHVLGGALSPIHGVGPGQLHIDELKQRIPEEGITEIIAATNPTVEGDTTAMYLAREFKGAGIKVTRLASGL